MKEIIIDAQGIHYTQLNKKIRQAINNGNEKIVLNNVLGQRFIANGLRNEVEIIINGIPGGDIGMFMDGPKCTVYGNCEHAPGNTMDGGMLVVDGSAGDAVAHSMRGGKIYIRNNIGYRGGIHMKEYMNKKPILVVGGTAHAFLGEYMAGGLILILGIGFEPAIKDRGIGSGIHGGEIIIRGNIEENLLGVGAQKIEFTAKDLKKIIPEIEAFCNIFGINPISFKDTNYTKIIPSNNRPFADKYTWE